MMSFRMKLAGISIQVHAMFETTEQFCRDYLTDESPSVEVSITQADLEEERRRSACSDEREGRSVVRYPDEYLETLALYRRILERLLPRHVLLFHGSALALNGKAYLFTARSGVGKTTHTRLWLKNIPDCYVLNGDKPLLLFREDAVYVCGTPWQGKENCGVNEMLPLEAICFLERDEENRIEPIGFNNALGPLSTQAHRPGGGENLVEFIKLIERLKTVKLYRLRCNMENEAAFAAYRGMVEKTP